MPGTVQQLLLASSSVGGGPGAIQGTLAAIEGADIAALTGIVVPMNMLSAVEGADLAAFTGDVLIMGSMAATEGADLAAFVGASWVDTFFRALNANSAGWNAFNTRLHLAASVISTSGTKVRITLEGPSSGQAVVDGCYIGHAAASGDAYDFDGTQVPVTFNTGSASVTVTTSEQKVSDEITYTVDETRALIVACHFNAATSVRSLSSQTGCTNYYKNAASEISVSNVTGYTSEANFARFVRRIEVQ